MSAQVRVSTQSEQPPTPKILILNKRPECLIGRKTALLYYSGAVG